MKYQGQQIKITVCVWLILIFAEVGEIERNKDKILNGKREKERSSSQKKKTHITFRDKTPEGGFCFKES